MPTFRNLFIYKTYTGVLDDVAIYLDITFSNTNVTAIYDEAHINLITGDIKFYLDSQLVEYAEV